MAKDPAFLFNHNEWKTPNTYDINFGYPPEESGVYLLVHTVANYEKRKVEYKILYVGSSKNLFDRESKHEVLRILRMTYNYIRFYWRTYDNYYEEEKRLIGLIKPKYNIQWKN